MKRIFWALLGIGIIGVAIYWSGGDAPRMVSPAEALQLARDGRVFELKGSLGGEPMILTLQDGEQVAIRPSKDPNDRFALARDIREAAPNDVFFAPPDLPRDGLRSNVILVFWGGYLLSALVVLDVVWVVRRRARRWESADVLWLVAIILLAPFGAVAWLIAGRRIRARELSAPSPRPGAPQLPSDAPAGARVWRDDPRIVH